MSNSNTTPARYLPRAHPFSWLILIVTTGSIAITSIDRTILPTVLPAILKEFHLSPGEGGLLIGLSYIGIASYRGSGIGNAWGQPGHGP